MSDAATFHATILLPALARIREIAPELTDTPDSRALLLAIAGQEGGWRYRIQAGNGPAHGFWQFERGGGIRALLANAATGPVLRVACDALGVEADETIIWGYISAPAGDVLACLMARLLLWSDPRPIPARTDDAATWEYYERNWRPGKPRPDDWPAIMAAARAAVDGETT